MSLDSKFHDEKNWTENDQKIVGEHFNYLKKAKADGKLILAGRTDESNEKTFGIVIFYATDSISARSFMNSDPVVKAGIMKATIHPYKVALIKD